MCSFWRRGDGLIKRVTGLLRVNRMQIESGHHRECLFSHKLSRRWFGTMFLHKSPGVIQSEKCAYIRPGLIE